MHPLLYCERVNEQPWKGMGGGLHSCSELIERRSEAFPFIPEDAGCWTDICINTEST